MSAIVHAANIHDTKPVVLTAKDAHERYSTIQGFCADIGYQDTFVSNIRQQFDLSVDLSEKLSLANGKNCLGAGWLSEPYSA